MVRRLADGQDVDVAAEAPDLPASSDEIGQVRQAFAAVQQTAVEAAVGQARLRQGISDIFRNLARRSQSLLHRQLALLDAMERRAREPEELEDLFRIDHLTTRMRRHAESLIILSGDAPARGWRNPVPFVDVLRAAVAEVEDYTRIKVTATTRAAIAGPAVADVIHMIAELAENAVIFSPPNTPVLISGDVVGRGFAVEIEDRGLGLSEERRAELNRLLENPPPFDLSGSDQLGLFVASQLAKKHNIRISLRSSPYGGTTAIVLIPLNLVVPEGSYEKGTATTAGGTAAIQLTGRHAVREELASPERAAGASQEPISTGTADERSAGGAADRWSADAAADMWAGSDLAAEHADPPGSWSADTAEFWIGDAAAAPPANGLAGHDGETHDGAGQADAGDGYHGNGHDASGYAGAGAGPAASPAEQADTDLVGAADLGEAADLPGADLAGADLARGADTAGADTAGADTAGADTAARTRPRGHGGADTAGADTARTRAQTRWARTRIAMALVRPLMGARARPPTRWMRCTCCHGGSARPASSRNSGTAGFLAQPRCAVTSRPQRRPSTITHPVTAHSTTAPPSRPGARSPRSSRAGNAAARSLTPGRRARARPGPEPSARGTTPVPGMIRKALAHLMRW